MTAAEPVLSVAVALGIGLLIGIERERRKGSGPARAPAGVRTFTLVSLSGAVTRLLPGPAPLVAGALFVAALVLLGYQRQRTTDPGITSEVALFITFLLGALCVGQPALAAGLAVVVAILLAAREPLHRFVRRVLTEQELHDALLFTAAALVIWPLLPDRALGPYSTLQPRVVWRLVVIVMAIGGAGYIALRAFGPRIGLPLGGFFAGFVSSSAAIASLGSLAARDQRLVRGTAAGALLSTVATVVQLVVVLLVSSPAVLVALRLPLLVAGAVAVFFGVVFGVRAARDAEDGPVERGRAFDPRAALGFAILVSAITLLSSLLTAWQGARGLLAATSLAGFADVHAAAISAAAMVAAGRIAPADAVIPILAAFTTNTVTKCVFAAASGSRSFAAQTIPGLLLVAVSAWAGLLFAGVPR